MLQRKESQQYTEAAAIPRLIPALGQMGEHPLEMDWPDLLPEFRLGRGERKKSKKKTGL